MAIYDLVLQSLLSIRWAIADLIYPAVFFLLLGYLVKGQQLWQDIRRARLETVLNLQIILFNAAFLVPVIALANQAMSAFISAHGLFLVPQTFWAALPAWLTFGVAIFLSDFIGYWRHRLEHSPLLWPAHAVHHSDTQMTWLSLERFHPINRISTFVIDTGVLLILGLPPAAALAASLVRHYYGFFIHADLPWTYGAFGKIFVSPAMHRWHHAMDPKAFNTNFATVFSIFDRAFGTFRVPGPCTVPLGVSEPLGQTLRSQLGYGLNPRTYRRLFGRN